jgi:hypothetical protein
MVIHALVMMAAEGGELSTAAEVDIMLRELLKSDHKDHTLAEVVDALLDVRTMMTHAVEVPVPV